METLTHWKARRSGGRITITGTDETGAEVKVPNVDTIEVMHLDHGSRIVARDKNADAYILLEGAA